MPRKNSKKTAGAKKARDKAIAATASQTSNSRNDSNDCSIDYYFAYTLSVIQACMVFMMPINMALTCYMFNFASVTSVTLATSVYICFECASFFVGLLIRLSKRRRRLIPRRDATLTCVLFFSLLALLLVVNAVGEGRGNNPNSWTIIQHHQFIRENYGNFFIQLMGIILYWRRYGRGPDPEDDDDEEWPVGCRLSFGRDNENRSICTIEGLSFLVSYMGQVAYGTTTAVCSWMTNFNAWGFFEVMMSDSYEGTMRVRSSLWSSVTNRFSFTSELYDFDEPLTDALQNRIMTQYAYQGIAPGALPNVVYNFWHKAVFYVREFVFTTATPSLFTSESANAVGEYLNNGIRNKTVERRLNELKMEYVADRSEPAEDSLFFNNKYYAIICKSRGHVIEDFNEEAYAHH